MYIYIYIYIKKSLLEFLKKYFQVISSDFKKFIQTSRFNSSDNSLISYVHFENTTILRVASNLDNDITKINFKEYERN